MVSLPYEPRIEWRYINKEVLYGMVISSSISLILLVLMIISFLRKIKNIKSFDKWMKINTLTHFMGNIVFCCGAAFFRCDLIFPIHYNLPSTLHPDHITCRICISIPYIGYYVSKIFLYLLFVRRIEATFNGSIHECNKTFIRIFQFIVISTLLVSMTIFLFFESYQYCLTKDDEVHICSVYTEYPLQNIGGLAIIVMSIFDLLYSTLTLFFFIYKLKKLINSQLAISVNEQVNDQYFRLSEDENNNNFMDFDHETQQKIKKLLAISLKCCVLCFVTVASNWLFVFVGLTFIFDLGWFICLDCLINAICVYLLYHFNDNLYRKVCFPMICLWNGIARSLGFTDHTMYKHQYKKTATMTMSNKKTKTSTNTSVQLANYQ